MVVCLSMGNMLFRMNLELSSTFPYDKIVEMTDKAGVIYFASLDIDNVINFSMTFSYFTISSAYFSLTVDNYWIANNDSILLSLLNEDNCCTNKLIT